MSEYRYTFNIDNAIIDMYDKVIVITNSLNKKEYISTIEDIKLVCLKKWDNINNSDKKDILIKILKNNNFKIEFESNKCVIKHYNNDNEYISDVFFLNISTNYYNTGKAHVYLNNEHVEEIKKLSSNNKRLRDDYELISTRYKKAKIIIKTLLSKDNQADNLNEIINNANEIISSIEEN